MKQVWMRSLKWAGLVALLVFLLGLLPGERPRVPVKGATRGDWNAKSFWCSPWGKSGVHKGIDIFAREGTPVLAATSGLVVYAGSNEKGGKVVSVLGPKWRIHYYAHLKRITVRGGEFVSRGTELGAVGTTGNAAGKPPHLHYAIITQVPYFWAWQSGRWGFDRMFYLDPGAELVRESAQPSKTSRG